MNAATAYPCISPRLNAFRISMSSVPGRKAPAVFASPIIYLGEIVHLRRAPCQKVPSGQEANQVFGGVVNQAQGRSIREDGKRGGTDDADRRRQRAPCVAPRSVV